MLNSFRQNGLQYQSRSFQYYPTLVVEMAVTNEDRELLLTDVDQKYFHANTSVQAWIRVKLDLQHNIFWVGWGRRTNIGYGLRLEQQTEDEAGNATFVPVYPYPGPNLTGQISIPSALILHPNPVPAGVPDYLVITLDQIRSWIEEGIDMM